MFTLQHTQDSVVDAVIDGRVDAGFIRTGLLEALSAEGRDLSGVQHPGFPLHSSTRLYPEWPLVALRQADPALMRKVAALALGLEAGDPAARAAGIHGFTIPADYARVEEMLRELRLPPFDASPAFTWNDVWARYRETLFVLGLATIAIVLLLARLAHRNLALSQASAAARRLAAEIELDRHHLRNVVEATQAGSWEWDLETGEWKVDVRWAAMLGSRPRPAPGSGAPAGASARTLRISPRPSSSSSATSAARPRSTSMTCACATATDAGSGSTTAPSPCAATPTGAPCCSPEPRSTSTAARRTRSACAWPRACSRRATRPS